MRIFVVLFTLVTVSSFAQVRTGAFKYEILDPNTAGKIFKNPMNTADKPNGSPYVFLMFASAKVANVSQSAFMRYNAYKDEFEFITPSNDTLILDKIEDFSNIVISGINKKYKLTAYTNSAGKLTYGYLIDFYNNGKIGLFKKENISFYEGKKAKTSLEQDMHAKYVKGDDTYFLKVDETKIVAFPGNKKQLIKLFPDKKEAIESFVKQNDISFDDENGRVQIVNFLSKL